MKTILMTAVAALSLIAGATAAQAVTLTFEGQSNAQYSAPVTDSGFVIGNVAGDEQHFHYIDAAGYGLPSNGTGVLLNDRDTRLQITRSGGGLFTLSSFDSAYDGVSSSQLTVAGFVGGVQTYTATFGLGTSFATHAFANFGFDTVVFDGIGGSGGFELDNVVVNNATGAVPEPATWAMMMLGFGGLGYAMRRKNKVAARIKFA